MIHQYDGSIILKNTFLRSFILIDAQALARILSHLFSKYGGYVSLGAVRPD
jgi:hypothetical protein